jgi:hypothetical protein
MSPDFKWSVIVITSGFWFSNRMILGWPAWPTIDHSKNGLVWPLDVDYSWKIVFK